VLEIPSFDSAQQCNSSSQSEVSLVFHQPALVRGQLGDRGGPPGNVSYLECVECYVTQGSKRLDQRRIRCLGQSRMDSCVSSYFSYPKLQNRIH
jgi:hypothetical protein